MNTNTLKLARIIIGLIISIPVYANAANGKDTLEGLKMGAGLSLTVDLGDNDRIQDASIVDGIVRVRDEDNSRARVMLESHYFFKAKSQFSAFTEPVEWGFGPFVAVQPGSNEIIEAIGAGLMIGFKRSGDDNSSFNLGLGVIVDPNVQVLGDGFTANEPPPGNETEVRFKEKNQAGLLFIASFTF